MTVQTINLGNYANDGTGDDLRTAFVKVNANFAMLDAEAAIAGAVNLGAGVGLYKDKNSTNLEFKSLTSNDSSVAITTNSTTVNLHAVTSLFTDVAPRLSHNLDLNSNIVFGGDVQTTIHNIDVNLLNSMMAVLIESNNTVSIDLGSFVNPTGYQTSPRGYAVDFGSLLSPINNTYNFGTF